VTVFHHSLTVKDHFSFVKREREKNTYKIKKGSQGTVAETKEYGTEVLL